VSAGAAAPAGARDTSAAGRIYVTDCEGPLTRNDNAQEIAERFVPDGAEFFARLSKYDDFLVDVAAKPGYNAGNTLRLIPPFFKAYYVTDEDVERFSAEQVLLVPRALKTLDVVSALMPTFIISTSYTPYLRALCEIAGFPLERVRCTELSLDAWQLPEDEATWLREWVPRVCARPIIDYPAEAMTAAEGHAGGAGADAGVPGRSAWRSPQAALEWLTDEDQATVRELDRLFWEEMPERRVSRALSESVCPIGGGQKLAALEEIVAAEGVEGEGVMYVGDSITDTPPLAAVKAWGGVSLSFNGNAYAIAAAEFAAASPDADVQARLAEAFAAGGRDVVEAVIRSWPKPKQGTPPRGEARATVGLVSEEREKLAEASAVARLSVRGERVARLG
jgi:energy-converting hydrogenase A subunit R